MTADENGDSEGAPATEGGRDSDRHGEGGDADAVATPADPRPAPDEAFAALGNETRMEILRILGEADEALSFSMLHDRSSMRDSGQFNYHLDKLVGHFVNRTDEGYVLGRPGRRIVEAVLSGAVTDDPELPRTRIDDRCEYCGAPIEIRWRAGSVEVYCTSCAGTYGEFRSDRFDGAVEEGYLGRLSLPPAGLQDRTPTQVFRTAWTWGNLEILAMSAGICPRCSATVAYDLEVCGEHAVEDGLCPSCERRHAVAVGVECTNCIFETGGPASLLVVAHTALLDLETDHGLNPVAPSSIRDINRLHEHYEETVRSTDPFEGVFTFAVGDDRLSLTIDDDLEVIAVERRSD